MNYNCFIALFCLQIKVVPSDSLRQLLSSFEQRGQAKQHLSKKLIVNLELESSEIEKILRICIEKRFLWALAYLYPRTVQDFRAPALQSLAQYLQDKVQNRQAGLFCLWFLRKSLHGFLYPFELMSETLHKIAAIQLVQWVFIKETLKELLRIDSFATFEIITLFFGSKLGSYLAEENDSLYNTLELDNQLKTKHELAERHNNLLEATPSVHSLLIQLIHDTVAFSSDLDETQCFHHLVLEAAFFDYEISPLMAEDCAFFFFANPNAICSKKQSHQLSIENKAERLVKMLGRYSDYFKKDNELLDRLIEKARYSPFVEANAFLCYVKKDYKECIDLYLASPKKALSMKIFLFLDTVFQEINEKEKAELIKYMFLQKLKDLVRLDSDKTRLFIERQSTAGEADQAIEKLSQFPELQFKLLDKIVNNKRANQQDVPEHLLILHLNLIAKLNPSKVVGELRKFDYPLDESLKICQQEGVLDATAFLYERSGDVTKAIHLYFEVIKRGKQ